MKSGFSQHEYQHNVPATAGYQDTALVCWSQQYQASAKALIVRFMIVFG